MTGLEKNLSDDSAQRYRPAQEIKEDETKIPLRNLQYAMLVSGIGTILSGAALAYSMFPDTIDSIIKYFSQNPF